MDGNPQKLSAPPMLTVPALTDAGVDYGHR